MAAPRASLCVGVSCHKNLFGLTSPITTNNPTPTHTCHRMYNRLVERCFKECVTRFRSKKMDDGELACVSKCAEKYLKLTSRAGFRFAEFQSQSAQVGGRGGWGLCVLDVWVWVVIVVGGL